MTFVTILAEMITQEREEFRRVSKVTMSHGYYIAVVNGMSPYLLDRPHLQTSKLLGVDIDVSPEDMDMWYTVEVEPLE